MSVLHEIFEHKSAEVLAARNAVSFEEIKSKAMDSEPPRGFRRALAGAQGLALIAEVKKASPSQGLIRQDFDPSEVAKSYERAGAHALSVLTDEKYFQGSLENLRIAKGHTNLPCLRKDFINDPYQVYEARAWGADAILLIVAALSKLQVGELRGLAESLRMDVLVEVHTESEAEIAIDLKCPLVGVNNRDLGNFKTSLTISEALMPAVVASGALGVSESALETREDLDRVEGAGARAVLIGTTFCAAPNIGDKVREVMGW